MDISFLIGTKTGGYEKKRTVETKNPKSWCKIVGAFANECGGKLVFGIADDDTIIGLEDAEQDIAVIDSIIRNHLKPLPEYRTNFLMVDGKMLIVLEVFAGSNTPYYYLERGLSMAFVRNGKRIIQATPPQLDALMQKGRVFPACHEPPAKRKFNDTTFTTLQIIFYEQTGQFLGEAMYEAFGLVDKEGYLTNTGILLTEEAPMKKSSSICTRWNGVNRADESMDVDGTTDADIAGNTLMLLLEGLNFVNRHSRKMWRKTTEGRFEMPDYPARAVLESIISAITHPNCNYVDTELHIDIFDDRIELYTRSGGMDSVRVQDRERMCIPSNRRSSMADDVFHRLQQKSYRESGFEKIFPLYQSLPDVPEDRLPLFSSEYGAFFLILWNLNYGMEEDIAAASEMPPEVQQEMQQKPETIPEKIMALLSAQPELTVSAIAASLELSVSSVRYQMDKLRKSGVLERVGGSKNGYWRIHSN